MFPGDRPLSLLTRVVSIPRLSVGCCCVSAPGKQLHRSHPKAAAAIFMNSVTSCFYGFVSHRCDSVIHPQCHFSFCLEIQSLMDRLLLAEIYWFSEWAVTSDIRLKPGAEQGGWGCSAWRNRLYFTLFCETPVMIQAITAFQSHTEDFIDTLTRIIIQFVPSIRSAVSQRELNKGFKEKFTCSHPSPCSGVSGKVLVVPAGASCSSVPHLGQCSGMREL